MKATRLDLMEQYIIEQRTISLEDLCSHFEISLSTARRDLNELVKRGHIEKVYGGIRAVDSLTPESEIPADLISFEERDHVNKDEKEQICHRAASLVEPKDIIFLDSGTTCIHMVDELKDIPCTVITNSLRVALKALPYENLTVISLPGRLNRKTWSYIDYDIERYLQSMNIQKAFMAATGVSIKGGLTNASEDEYIVKKNVCRNSHAIYLLADHEKFYRTALYTYSDLKGIDGIITDQVPPKAIKEYCEEERIQLLYSV